MIYPMRFWRDRCGMARWMRSSCAMRGGIRPDAHGGSLISSHPARPGSGVTPSAGTRPRFARAVLLHLGHCPFVTELNADIRRPLTQVVNLPGELGTKRERLYRVRADVPSVRTAAEGRGLTPSRRPPVVASLTEPPGGLVDPLPQAGQQVALADGASLISERGSALQPCQQIGQHDAESIRQSLQQRAAVFTHLGRQRVHGQIATFGAGERSGAEGQLSAGIHRCSGKGRGEGPHYTRPPCPGGCTPCAPERGSKLRSCAC